MRETGEMQERNQWIYENRDTITRLEMATRCQITMERVRQIIHREERKDARLRRKIGALVHKSGGKKSWERTRCGLDATVIPFFDKDESKRLKERERVGAVADSDLKSFQWNPVTCPRCKLEPIKFVPESHGKKWVVFA